MAEVTLRNITRRFGETLALDGVSMTVPDGAFVVLLGPTGAGKTTTLRLISGLDAPDGGEISIGGRDVAVRHQQNRDRAQGGITADLPAEREAVDLGHQHVGDDGVRSPGARRRERRLAVARQLDLEAELAEAERRELPLPRIIVGHRWGRKIAQQSCCGALEALLGLLGAVWCILVRLEAEMGPR